jgi:predicted GIY-YIG superfamily endonuclease
MVRIKKLLSDIADAMFRRPTVEDAVAHEMHKAHAEAMQAEASIKNHQFIRHLALSRIEALEDWNHGRIKQ